MRGRPRCRSKGTSEPGLVIRPADAEVIPPLSDYLGFWHRQRPFVLLTGGRTRHYHTPHDVASTLDFDRMARTARWLERFVRDQCARPADPFVFRESRDDLSTLESLHEVFTALAPVSKPAEMGLDLVGSLRASVLRDRTVPKDRRSDLGMLVEALETGLA